MSKYMTTLNISLLGVSQISSGGKLNTINTEMNNKD